jgi:hypothetical protein
MHCLLQAAPMKLAFWKIACLMLPSSGCSLQRGVLQNWLFKGASFKAAFLKTVV